MKRIWTLWILVCSAAVFLVACSGNQALEAIQPTDSPSTAVAAPTTALPVTTSNLSRIGQTGQPQLLNTYASW